MVGGGCKVASFVSIQQAIVLSLAFTVLILAITAGPVLAVPGGVTAQLVPMILATIGLISVAISARQSDVAQFQRATSGLLWLALLGPLLIMLQLLPLPATMSHPIWLSASEALGSPSVGHLTVDVGASIAALLALLAATALAMVTIVVARDRRRAELLLFAASTVCGLIGVATLLQSVEVLSTVPAFKLSRDMAIDLNGFGVVLNLAVMLLAFERRETRHQAAAQYIPIGIGGLIGVLINLAALLETRTGSSGIGAGFGVYVLLLIVVIRRIDLGPWSIAVLGLATLAGVAILVGWLIDRNPGRPALLRFTTTLPAESTTVIERLLSEGRWTGSGAGTFSDIARIFQTGEDSQALRPPSTAIALWVEMRWIGMLGALAVSLTLLATLLRNALERGRDSFYAAAAAACIAAATAEAFAGAGLLQPSVGAMLAIVTGLGLAQGISQYARP